MNNLLVRDVKYLDEQYRIGEGIISDNAFKQLEKLLIPVDLEPDYFNQKNNKLLPKLAKENYKEFLESLLTKTRLSIQPKIDGCAIAIRYIDGKFNKAITKKGFDVSSKIKQIKNVSDYIPIKRDFQIRGELYATNQVAGISQRIENTSMIRKGLIAFGKGSGHGVGMSQWGAKYLASRGQKAERILKHFYKGVQIKPFRKDYL